MFTFFRKLVYLVNHGECIMATLAEILQTEQAIGAKIDALSAKVDALKQGQADPATLQAIADVQAANAAKLDTLNA